MRLQQYRQLSGQAKRICSNKILSAADHRCWLPDGAYNIPIAETGPCSAPPISIPSMFSDVVDTYHGHTALHTRDRHGGDLKWSYEQYMMDVRTAAKGFIALGLDRFHTVGLLGYNSPEWAIANVAAVHAGGFGMGIYQTNSAAACHYVADNSRANILVVENQEQLDKILSVRDKLPHLRQIIHYTDIDSGGHDGVMSWSQLLDLGRDQSDQQLDQRLTDIAVNQCACLSYTSGTTGNPKGVMLSHDAIVFAAREMSTLHFWQPGNERIVSYLPLSHIAGMMHDIYYPMSKGVTTCFADSNALKGTLIENLKYYQPTRFFGVPRVWEKMEEKIRLVGKETKGVKRKLADWAKNEALNYHLQHDAGNGDQSLGYKVAQKLVMSKIREALGLQHCGQYFATGGAAIAKETHLFFMSIDIRLAEVYGSTESLGPQIQGRAKPGQNRIGSVGKLQGGLAEGKLFNLNERNEGEICTRGRCTAMGYLFDKNKTLDTFDDEGWLHTGDLGTLDNDGFYSIVGRIKEIIITAGGENIAPVNIEDEIKRELDSFVSNIMVVGEKRRFLSCLLTVKVKPDPETLAPTTNLEDVVKDWVMKVTGVKVETVADVVELLHAQDEGGMKLARAIDEGIHRANSRAISRAATVQKWTIVPREFSVAAGELSPSLKLKRFAVHDMYKKEIDTMYEHEGQTSVAW